MVERVRMETVTLGRKPVQFFGFNTELSPRYSPQSSFVQQNKGLCQCQGGSVSSQSWLEPWQPVWDMGCGSMALPWLYRGKGLKTCICLYWPVCHSQTQRNLLRGQPQLFIYNLEMPPRFLYNREKGRGKLKKIRLSWKQENLYHLFTKPLCF